MPPDRLLTWSLKTNSLVPLVRIGHEGGQTILYEFEGDRSMVAGVPVPGQDPDAYWAKINALQKAKVATPSIAWPEEVLVCPRDRSSPKAFSMKRAVGPGLDALLLPAERQALGLHWGRTEFLTLALLLCELFSFTELHGFTQNDTHPGQYIVALDRWGKKPRAVIRVDTPAFSFWHGQVYYGTDGARWDYVPPELQWVGRRPEGLKGHNIPREADRFGLACLLFQILTGGAPTDYVGGDPDPGRRVERKEFAVISMPAGATVAPEVERAFYNLPVEVTAALERALTGDPTKRPSPAELRRALKVASHSGALSRRPAFGVLLKGAMRGGRSLVSAAKKNAWWIAAAASIAAAIWSLPRSDPHAALTSSIEETATSQPLSQIGPGPIDPLDIPPPAKSPSRPDAHLILNRKAGR